MPDPDRRPSPVLRRFRGRNKLHHWARAYVEFKERHAALWEAIEAVAIVVTIILVLRGEETLSRLLEWATHGLVMTLLVLKVLSVTCYVLAPRTSLADTAGVER